MINWEGLDDFLLLLLENAIQCLQTVQYFLPPNPLLLTIHSFSLSFSFSYPNFYFCNWKAVNKHLIFSSCNQTTNVMDLWVISQCNNGPKPDHQKWGTSLLIDTNVTHLGECLHDSKIHISHFAVLFHSRLLIFTFYQKVPKHGKSLITTFICTPGERYFSPWHYIQFPSLLYSPLLW
jgi:hypothetical protein